MVESALVYIYRIKPTKQFVGCGAVVSGGFIATCRHVWRDAEAAFGDDPEARAEAVFPHARKDGALATSTVLVADRCRPGPDAPEPDLVLLEALEIPQAVLRLEPASEDRKSVV